MSVKQIPTNPQIICINPVFPGDEPIYVRANPCLGKDNEKMKEIKEDRDARGGRFSYQGDYDAESSWCDEYSELANSVTKTPMYIKVMESITYVCQEQFMEKLNFAMRDAYTKLNSTRTFQLRQDGIVLVEPNKSNLWVAELALKHGFCPSRYCRLGDKDARNFVLTINRLYDKKSPDLNFFKGKTLILFDDASYSGKQLHDHIAALSKVDFIRKTQHSGIVLICPYMTQVALKKLTEIKTNVESRPLCEQIFIHINHREIMKSLDTILLSASEQNEIQTMWHLTPDKIQHLATTYFFHKVANDMSFPEPLKKGTIYDQHGNPIPRQRREGPIPEIDTPYKSSESTGELVCRDMSCARRANGGLILDDGRECCEVEKTFTILEILDISVMVDKLIAMTERNPNFPREALVFSDLDDTLFLKGGAGCVSACTAGSIKRLQESQFQIYGCTARKFDPYCSRECEKTFEEMARNQIRLGPLELPKEQCSRHNSECLQLDSVGEGQECSSGGCFYFAGVIFAPPNSPGKGSAVESFLWHNPLELEGQVKSIIMIDDKIDELEKVMEMCKKHKLNFLGFHLKPSSRRSGR